ncbi:MAG: type II toxin-antitoxin system VapC family toxin [Planctomycetes bacterium]|nr:type II toxin-antitoxin system VapC family toxin [Planctomycetota bacterium]
MKVLLDTNICIYLIKNNPPAARRHFMKYSPGDIGISAITVAELFYGVAKSAAVAKNRAALETFLLPLEIMPFDAKAAVAYGRIRAELEKKGRPIGPLDMLIAAIAVRCEVLLVTNNLKEFRRVSGLKCETWV